jgi:hypothetical protein
MIGGGQTILSIHQQAVFGNGMRSQQEVGSAKSRRLVSGDLLGRRAPIRVERLEADWHCLGLGVAEQHPVNRGERTPRYAVLLHRESADAPARLVGLDRHGSVAGDLFGPDDLHFRVCA